MKKIMILFISTFLMAAPSFAEPLVIDQEVPDFTLQDTEGNTVSLSDFKGETVVLEWSNPDCPFVVKHYGSGNMQQLQNYYGEAGIKWLIIASSAPGKQGHYSAEEWNAIIQKQEAGPAAVLLDPTGEVGRLFNAKTTPHMYIINEERELLYQGAIDSKNSANPEDIASSTNYVSEALDALLADEQIEITETRAYGCSIKY